MADAMKLEDVLFFKLKDLILEQSEGEWTEEMIVRDAHHFANNLRPLLAAAPPAREEAPAEGLGVLERAKLASIVHMLSGMEPGDTVQIYSREAAIILAALRARTSEPEAGAVAWLHTLHMELDQTFSRLTENPQHPFGKPGEDYSEEYRVSTTPLFAHPAPATADKLRAAVDLLEEVKSRTYVGKGDKPVMRSRYGHYDASVYHKVCAFLAALNEQPQ